MWEWERKKGKSHEGSEWWENVLWPKNRKSFFYPYHMCFSSFCRLWWEVLAVLSVDRTRVHSIAHLIARHRVNVVIIIASHKRTIYIISREKKPAKIENISSSFSSLMCLILLLLKNTLLLLFLLLSVLTHDLFIGEFSRVYTSNRSRVEVHSAQFLLLPFFVSAA